MSAAHRTPFQMSEVSVVEELASSASSKEAVVRDDSPAECESSPPAAPPPSMPLAQQLQQNVATASAPPDEGKILTKVFVPTTGRCFILPLF